MHNSSLLLQDKFWKRKITIGQKNNHFWCILILQIHSPVHSVCAAGLHGGLSLMNIDAGGRDAEETRATSIFGMRGEAPWSV